MFRNAIAIALLLVPLEAFAATVSTTPATDGTYIRKSSNANGAIHSSGVEKITTFTVTVADGDDLVLSVYDKRCIEHCAVVVTPSTAVTAPASISDGAYRNQRITLINAHAGYIFSLLSSLTNVDFGPAGDVNVTEDGPIELVWDGTDWRLVGPPSFSRTSKVVYSTDFLFGATADELPLLATAGSGTGNAVAVSAGQHGRFSITTASNDTTHAGNGSGLSLDALNWRADTGGMMVETRVQLDAVTGVQLFVGFTDTVSSTVEAPIFMNAADIDSDASNAAGIMFDTDATTDVWTCGGVATDVDTAPVLSASAPSAATYYTLRVEISEAGSVRCFVDGVAVGAATASAITPSTAVVPIIFAQNRAAAARVALVDYLYVEATRE